MFLTEDKHQFSVLKCLGFASELKIYRSSRESQRYVSTDCFCQWVWSSSQEGSTADTIIFI